MKLSAIVISGILLGVNVQDINYQNLSQHSLETRRYQNHRPNKYVKECKLSKVYHLPG